MYLGTVVLMGESEKKVELVLRELLTFVGELFDSLLEREVCLS